MSIKELAEKSGVSVSYLRNLLRGDKERETALYYFVRLSEALGVPIDDLLMDHDEGVLDVGTFNSHKSRTENPNNGIAVYRRQKGLTYRDLALRMGLTTREAGRKACTYDVPKEKHLRALADYEGITPEEFCRWYSGASENGVGL